MGTPGRLPELATELVRSKIDIIVASSANAALAAKNATTSIPIVMEAGDPVGFGLVAAFPNQSNVTGLSSFSPDLAGKRLELFKEVLPRLSRLAILWNDSAPFQQFQVNEIEMAARSFGIQVHRLAVQNVEAIEKAFSAMNTERAHAFMVIQALFFLISEAK